MSPVNAAAQMDHDSGIEVEVLPFVRLPVLDRDDQLVAYEICHQTGGDANLAQATLRLFGSACLKPLTGDQLSFLAADAELLRGDAGALRFDARVGPRVDAALAVSDDVFTLLSDLAARGVPVMIDNPEWPDEMPPGAATQRLKDLVQRTRCVGIDVRQHDESTLLFAVASLRAARTGVTIVAAALQDHRAHRACMDLGFDAFEGPYLLKPAPQRAIDTLKPNRVNVLRLLAAVQNPENGPRELEELIRNDAVLSYKLLNCVNSAYFSLPRELKSLQQAAVFFGVARLRNWIYALALGELDDAPPELLKQALLRARMSELLAQRMPSEQREMAFTTGLFSLLDTIMGVPMLRVLTDVPVADLVRHALVDGKGPLAEVLQRIREWETVDTHGGVSEGGNADVAEAYLGAVEWAEHVYSFARRAA